MELQRPRAASTRTAIPVSTILPQRRSLVQRVRDTPPRFLYGALAGFAAYLLAMHFSTGNRLEQFALLAPMLLLVVWSDATRRFFAGMLPFLLFGIVYDLMHITEPLFHYLHIHVEEPYRFDKFFFGIPTAEGRLTPNEFLQRHTSPVADLFTGIAYIIFVYWAIGFGAYLALFRRDEEGQRLLRRFGWTFLLMNIAGFVTYYIYPAAPPWYVADYGLGPANMDARSSMAGAARFDALTGIPYFASFYGRSADVFGAIPSLHVSYPLLTFLHGRELGKRWLDVASFALFLLVSFAAVYLNHHYVLDVLLGVLYTVVAWRIDVALERRRQARVAAAIEVG
jgi:inositol phosphorylceramide synthase catalytic subunit